MSKSYYKKLKDPKWQKKRLEILQRDDFSCKCCGDSDNTLNVHHGYYSKEFENPWEYPNETLWTLCDLCHSRTHDYLHDIKIEMARVNPKYLSLFFRDVIKIRKEINQHESIEKFYEVFPNE